jgi:galactokinase
VRVASAPADGGAIQEYVLGREAAGRGFLDYVQGVTRTLAAAGHALRGFDARIASAVPLGAGLASSAALTVALARALREAFGLALDDVPLALAAQRAECDFVGARVGVMDPLAATLADVTSALLIDTRTLAVERIPLPAGMELVAIDSGVAHSHASGGYNARRAECEAACHLLGVPTLRVLEDEEPGRAAALPEPLARRVRHVLAENARVRAAVAALRARDLPALGTLLSASHASLRDDYEVSTPDVDALVAIALATPGVLGARLTGGGFGGAVLVLVDTGDAAALAPRIAAAYATLTGRRPAVLLPARERVPG